MINQQWKAGRQYTNSKLKEKEMGNGTPLWARTL